MALNAELSAAPEQLSAATSALDRAVAKGVIHKNTANRKKARMARALNKAQA
ncbi:MAG TPA: 30S ribosomal protein S20 [Clostridia bacterium]|nr:30S ribosomal protein S20 [Clostridia bacterium]